MHGMMGDTLIIQINLTSIRFNQTNQHVKTSGFAGSIWTKQTNHFARIDLQTDAINDIAFVVTFKKLLCD
jgi:hypothetical protein